MTDFLIWTSHFKEALDILAQRRKDVCLVIIHNILQYQQAEINIVFEILQFKDFISLYGHVR